MSQGNFYEVINHTFVITTYFQDIKLRIMMTKTYFLEVLFTPSGEALVSSHGNRNCNFEKCEWKCLLDFSSKFGYRTK